MAVECERMLLNSKSNKKDPWLDFTFKFLEKRKVPKGTKSSVFRAARTRPDSERE